MGPLPKNKVTRVEQGKRRRGNKPKITKDIKIARTPLHKRGLAAQILKLVGLA